MLGDQVSSLHSRHVPPARFIRHLLFVLPYHIYSDHLATLNARQTSYRCASRIAVPRARSIRRNGCAIGWRTHGDFRTREVTGASDASCKPPEFAALTTSAHATRTIIHHRCARRAANGSNRCCSTNCITSCESIACDPARGQGEALGEHREILEALSSRNPEAAEGTMRHHIRNARLRALSVLDQESLCMVAPRPRRVARRCCGSRPPRRAP